MCGRIKKDLVVYQVHVIILCFKIVYEQNIEVFVYIS